MKKTIFILFISILFSNSSFSQKDFAVLHFINVNELFGAYGIRYPTIQLNNTLIGESDPRSYLIYTMYSEGKTSLISRSDLCHTVQLQLDIKHGEEYYFRIRYKTSGYDSKHPCIEQITKDEALDLLKDRETKSVIELYEDKQNPIGALSIKRDKKGTGFLINSSGYILTNYHVIEDAKTIKVKGIKGDLSTTFDAKIIAVDIATDLALLQISSTLISFDSPLYFWGDIAVQKAEDAYVLGYPMTESMGEEIKITKGVINSLSGFKGDVSSLQLSAQVQPGNSGGPVLNKSGQLIGIINSKLKAGDDVGYAIKISYVQNFLKQTGISFDQSSSTTETDILKLIDSYSKCVYIVESYVE